MKKSSIRKKATVLRLVIIISDFGAIVMQFFVLFFYKCKAAEIRFKVNVPTKSLKAHVYHVIVLKILM